MRQQYIDQRRRSTRDSLGFPADEPLLLRGAVDTGRPPA